MVTDFFVDLGQTDWRPTTYDNLVIEINWQKGQVMFNSPLQYCPICKQQVALDQTKEQCAEEQNCKVKDCPLSHLFVPPNSVDNQDEKRNPDNNTLKGMEFWLP